MRIKCKKCGKIQHIDHMKKYNYPYGEVYKCKNCGKEYKVMIKELNKMDLNDE